jgi:hypothetical protein
MPPPDLPSLLRALRSVIADPARAVAMPSPPPTARASKPRVPPRWLRSPASPLDGSARRPRWLPGSRSWDWLRFGPAVTVEGCPDAGKREQRSILIQCEPHHVFLLGLWVGLRRILGKAVGRDQAAVSRLQAHAPVKGRGVANIGDRSAAHSSRPRRRGVGSADVFGRPDHDRLGNSTMRVLCR